jgi:predicted nucleotidyltransferase
MARERLQHLTPKEKLALQEYLNRLRQEYGRDVLSVKLYGSKARGDYHEDSDLDLFVRIGQDNRQTYAKMYLIASDIELKYDLILGMMLVGPTHHSLMRRLGEPLYRNVQREGIELWTRTPRALSTSDSNAAEKI